MQPINYYHCPDCQYPTYGPRKHILSIFQRYRKCPKCNRPFDDTDPTRIATEKPDYTTEQLAGLAKI